MVGQTVTIPDLPVELRDNIVARLDIRDVVSLSLACKSLHTIMESRQTWMKFAKELQLQPQVSKMEEPLEDLTTQELRDWTIRRHKISHCLDSGSLATCHYIWGIDDAQQSVLLPGGRWLLFERSLGNISYSDCDTPRPEAQPLISLGDVEQGYIRTQFVVWRDPDSSRLTLRVAVLYWYDRENAQRSYQAHFCKIDLIGHGSSVKLMAERIHVYQGNFSIRATSGEAIRGEHFYQIHHVQIYGCSPRLLNRRIILEIVKWRLDVLPDGRIVVSGATGVVIYPNPLPIVENKITTLAPSLVIKNVGYSMRGGPVHMSEWYCGLESSMAVYGASGKRMIAVWVPHDGSPPMKKIIAEITPNNAGCCTLGLFHGVSMVSRGCINIFSYPWGDSQSQTDSGWPTARVFKIEPHQDDAKYDLEVAEGGVIDDDVDEEGSIFEAERWETDGVEILHFNEELGRTIIRDRDCGFFVLDVVAE